MKVVIIGGTGHIGTYLTPALVQAGHEVVCVSRKQNEPYEINSSWKSVKHVIIDRKEAEQKGDFGFQIKQLKGDVIIDLICFTQESAAELTNALNGDIQHFIHCGTMWVHGHSECVPTEEHQKRKPFGTYGIDKAKIEKYLLSIHKEQGFPVTILHPGHITGPGWLPINPAGNLDSEVYIKLSKGDTVALPNFGMETLHHVHAADVAQAFIQAIENKEKSIGESFHVVSEQALTLRGYAEAMAEWFGQEANLSFHPWEIWKKMVDKKDAALTYDHIAHSPNGSISKANNLLKYQPKYSSLEAIQEAVQHFLDSSKK